MIYLKRISTLLFLSVFFLPVAFSQQYPKVSSNGNDYWYYIRFMRTGNVMEAQANGSDCKTATAKQSRDNTQLWKIVATGDAAKKKYQIVNKAGATLYLNGNFKASTSPSGTRAFHIFFSKNTNFGDGGLEIAADSTGGQAMNQVGEPKVGQTISTWTTGDDNNVLQFYTKSNMRFAYNPPTPSTAQKPIYYYIQFQKGNWLLSAKNNKAVCKTASLVNGTLDDLLFRVTKVGNQYAFTSKSGKTLYLSGTKIYASTKATKDSLFYIVESGNTTLYGYEVGTVNGSYGQKYLNMFQGAEENHDIALWNLGDEGNILRFIPSDQLVPVTGIASYKPANKYTLWYTTPATNWMTSCLPIGNGQFGATLMGDVGVDDVQFNDKTLWSGQLGSLTSPTNYGFYLNFGHLYIRSTGLSKATDYVRFLDINDAVAGVDYKMDGVDYKRRYFASNPDSCVVVRYTASQSGKINTILSLRDQNANNLTYKVDNDHQATITFSGKIPRWGDAATTIDPERYYCVARIVTEGGKVSLNDEGLVQVSGADNMTIYLRGLTDFDPDAAQYVSGHEQLPTRAMTTVNNCQNKGYNEVLSAHKSDYQSLFNRCLLTLAEPKNTIPTPQLITNYKNNPIGNLFLEELYFSYGRYLFISSSRGVSLPANLQGIWNNSNTPAWHSDIHSNINVEMNYWPAEPTNLSELHAPFLDYIYREACVKPSWRQFARTMGNVNKGWTIPTENNIYGSGSTFANNYTVANAWYCQHLWQHYTYTLDKDFLKSKALPVMKSCAEYWIAKLKLNTKDGTYECPNEWSPEHGGNDNATAHSQQLVWDLFNNTLEAIKVLGDNSVDAAFKSQLEDRFKKLDTGCHTEVNPADGKTYLREWKNYSQFNNPSFIGVNEYKAHRHISHLMGLYPCNQIGKDIDENIFQAAKVSLIARGDGHGTGWSLGHKINLNARAYMGDHCHNLIKRALQQTWTTGTNEAAGGVYENLWDAHAPYQIDGNFGYTAGIAEMLLQSRFGKLEILPAIPTKFWNKGSVKGLKAVGNFTVDIEWADTIATNINIVSNAGMKCVVKYNDINKKYQVTSQGKPVAVTKINDGEISFPTVKGSSYTITPKGTNVNLKKNDNGGAIKSVEYYSLNGTRIAAPAHKGIYLRKAIFDNGTSRSEKLILQ